MKLLFTFLVLLVITLVSNTNSLAQDNQDEPFIALSGASGEETIAHLERIVRDFKSGAERLFIISRLGTNEYPRKTNFRLLNTQQHLSAMGIDSEKVIFAEGERVKGEGRIEFYLGSHLRLVILAKHNQMPNLTCCPDYFPPIKRKTRKRKN
jgi:hypothetical protein